MRVHTPRFLIALAAVALFAIGCGSNDRGAATTQDLVPSSTTTTTTLAPDPWLGAEQKILAACVAADGGVTLDESVLDDYCRCSYIEVVEFYGTVEAFEAAVGEDASLDPLLASAFAGCTPSSDPEDWVEADETGEIEENFIRACTEGNDGTSDASDLADYCGCAYDGLRAEYADDFQGFLTLNRDLGNDPTAVPANISDIFTECASAHLD